jgi:hypothetical protein
MLGKHTLAPKEKTSLKITFNTEGSPGPFRKTLTISTEIPGQEEIEITVEGNVKEAPAAKIQVTPKRIDLGKIKAPYSINQGLVIANTGVLPLIVKRISVKGSGTVHFDGKREGDMVIQPGLTGKIDIEIIADRPGEQARELITIESNAKNAPKGGYVVAVQYDSR